MSDPINDFIKWLEGRNLFICNVSNTIFWPANTEGLAQRFIEEVGLQAEIEDYPIPDSTRHRYVTTWRDGKPT